MGQSAHLFSNDLDQDPLSTGWNTLTAPASSSHYALSWRFFRHTEQLQVASSFNAFSPGAVASLTLTKQNYCKKDQTSYLDPHSKSDKWRLTRIPCQTCINPAGDCYILLLGVGVDPTYSKITHLPLHFLGTNIHHFDQSKLNIIQSCECWKGSQTPRRSSMCPCFGPLFQLLVFLEKKHNDLVLRASLGMDKNTWNILSKFVSQGLEARFILNTVHVGLHDMQPRRLKRT